MTSHQVHFAIQQMNSKLSVYSDAIAIEAIASKLHADVEELLIHIDTLNVLSYISFIDYRNKKVRLTYSGINTIVPKSLLAAKPVCMLLLS